MEEYNPKKGLDRKTLEDAMKIVFDKKPVERRINGYRGCLTYGLTSLDSMQTCDNPSCGSCIMMKAAWKKAADELLAKINPLFVPDGKKEKDL